MALYGISKTPAYPLTVGTRNSFSLTGVMINAGHVENNTGDSFSLSHKNDSVTITGDYIIHAVVKQRQKVCAPVWLGCGEFYDGWTTVVDGYVDCRDGVTIWNAKNNDSGSCNPYDPFCGTVSGIYDVNIYVESYKIISDCYAGEPVCDALGIQYCDCTPWSNAECVSPGTRKTVRGCTPDKCSSEEDYISDTTCACTNQYIEYNLGCVRSGYKKIKRVWQPGFEYCSADGTGVDYYEKADTLCVCGAQYTDTPMGCVGVGVRKYKRTWKYGYCSADGTGVDYYEVSDPTCIEAEEVCDSTHLSLCNTQVKCTNVGLYWYNNKCNKTAQKPEEWYDWFTQDSLIPNVQNYILVAVGIAVPVVLGVGAYLVLRKPSKKKGKK